VNNNTLLDMRDQLEPLFPELEGRLIAVSEMEVNRSNVPKMPIGMIVLTDATFQQNEKTNKPPVVSENIVVEFWFKNNKIRRTDKSETEFWAFYDYDGLLERFLNWLYQYRSPRNYRVQPIKMDLESNELAVMLTFTLKHTYDFCPIGEEPSAVRLVHEINVKCGCEDTTLPTGD
jgi:hypothetical protein